ncbi:hypothetical protein R3Q06_30900 [Rhodococcus erythropolis]|uniref:hypothetical protein n=1 Tax=Rhodococcus erythropolis TaxID=1833 RepID=UPI0029494DED|nr:hypothetical protein [Rhodococcus erythropolis]MDV6277900.1 hypothetical protein [Rhodococcus erythropolis]
MPSYERATDASPSSPVTSLTVPAARDRLPTLRVLVRTAAAQYALSVDGLADLVCAVDEAAVALVDHALPDSTLTCTFESDALAAVRVQLSVRTSVTLHAGTITAHRREVR